MTETQNESEIFRERPENSELGRRNSNGASIDRYLALHTISHRPDAWLVCLFYCLSIIKPALLSDYAFVRHRNANKPRNQVSAGR
jgi:hypothetical protein